MPALSGPRVLASATLADFAAINLAFICDLRRRFEISETWCCRYRRIAHHFLIWLELTGIELKTVDGTIIDRFLGHDCRCGASGAPVHLQQWRKRRTSPELMSFIRFLERTGHIETPGELEDNLRLLDAFLTGLRDAGYAAATIRLFRQGCTGLIVWLHLSRIRLCELTSEVYARFENRQFVCSIPGVLCGRGRARCGTAYEAQLRGFLKHLVVIGRIAPLEPAPVEQMPPDRLERFALWLEHHRGIGEGSIRRHVRLIAGMMPELGDDPGIYDVALIRRVLLKKIQPLSPSHAKVLTCAMRMYLRFLASEDSVPGALVAAVPSVPRWSLSTLPRYISSDDVERAIACCGDHPAGVRDRAILLLLARLALRAGDIVALRLGDIDWDRAWIRVSGKSRREAVLPLPQDAGDALHAYIATVRPRVDEEKVFLCVLPPWRAFAGPGTVSALAKHALDRAGVKTSASRGAHVFRHSQATSLLRSGATLEVIQALLRHTSPNTTMIYAKTDAAMLLEVAQPWIGGIGS